MGCVIDHLRADHRVRVLRDFRDARGTSHRAGTAGVIRRLDLDWSAQEIVIEWERDGGRETLRFALAAKSGPGNGRMREFFALEDYVASAEEVARLARRRVPSVPALVEEPVTAPGRYGAAMERVWALAAARRWTEAEQQIALILTGPDEHGGRLEELAGDLVGVACAHAHDADPAVFDWVSERAINLWYAWGSQATSGGEGAVKAVSIRAAERRIAECRAMRAGRA